MSSQSSTWIMRCRGWVEALKGVKDPKPPGSLEADRLGPAEAFEDQQCHHRFTRLRFRIGSMESVGG